MKVALVTGAASGIGAACVERLTRSKWRTAGIDLQKAQAEMSAELDVADRAAVLQAVGRVIEHFGRLDLVVTAAGYYEEGIGVTEITNKQWDRMLAVTLGGTANTFAAALPQMLKQDSGAMVAISSELALTGSSTDLHYVAAKGCVLGLVKSLALEVAHTGVRINAIAPGPTDTPLLKRDSPWRMADYLATLPLGRLVTAEEVAETVFYLATEGAMYCGEVLSPNAGTVI